MTTWTFFDGEWREGNPAIMGPMTHAVWLGSTVFDGARAFEGVTPDLDRHLERVVNSAATFGLDPFVTADEMAGLAADGLKRFAPDAELYIRPMYWAESGNMGLVNPDPETTRFCLTLHDAPMPAAEGFSVTTASVRRPTRESAPTDAKAGCLYPNSARALREANEKGYQNALVRDALGNVSELATANVFMAKDGVALTPYPNGVFLNGVTRQRVIQLLRADGVEVREIPLNVEDFLEADEMFSTGNYGKVLPITKFETREMQPGPIFRRARSLYWDYAHSRVGGGRS